MADAAHVEVRQDVVHVEPAADALLERLDGEVARLAEHVDGRREGGVAVRLALNAFAQQELRDLPHVGVDRRVELVFEALQHGGHEVDAVVEGLGEEPVVRPGGPSEAVERALDVLPVEAGFQDFLLQRGLVGIHLVVEEEGDAGVGVDLPVRLDVDVLPALRDGRASGGWLRGRGSSWASFLFFG